MVIKRFLLFILFIVALIGILLKRELKLVESTPLNSWNEDQTADCGVVLTGGSARLNEGLDMLYLGQIRRLIVSGVNEKSSLELIFPKLPFYGDIDTEKIFLEKRSKTTYGNAVQSWALVESLSCQDVVLITSKIHMYRAYRTFRSEFPDDFIISKRAVLSAPFKNNFSLILMESIKSLFYKLWVN